MFSTDEAEADLSDHSRSFLLRYVVQMFPRKIVMYT